MTYPGAGLHDWDRLQADIAAFRRRVRAEYPGVRLLTAPELHKTGHGWHVHVAVDRFIPQARLADLWGHGYVWIDRHGDSPKAGREAGKVIGRYLAKYLSKSMDNDARPRGGHAYEVSQGSQPRALWITGYGESAVRAAVDALMGGEPRYSWTSDSREDWKGPAMRRFSWGPAPPERVGAVV
jgi:hypothetical protein